MKGFLILLFLVLASIANGQTVQVTSGDHPNFSRLVLTFPTAVDWKLSRTEGGYRLSTGKANVRYNLTDVFRRITKDRLASVFSDPDTDDLRLGVPCDCHAMPFELRPGTIVIDIKNGPAPDGSSFELTTDGVEFSTSGKPQVEAQAKPPSFQQATEAVLNDIEFSNAVREATRITAAAKPLPIAPEEEVITNLRNSLSEEIGRAAGRGVIDLAETKRNRNENAAENPSFDQIRIGSNVGVDPEASHRSDGQMTGQGQSCISDNKLSLSDWGKDGDVAQNIGFVRADLLTEFDRPNPEAVALAVKYNLYLGFGAEAHQILEALEIGASDRLIWEALAQIVDDETPTATVFEDMEVCDGAAALWAVLSKPELASGAKPATPAILRAFSALPIHLRRLLGPRLAERYLEYGDQETVRAIGDAVRRAAGDPGAGLELVDAHLKLEQGNMDAARSALAPLTKVSGPISIEATISMIQSLADDPSGIDDALVTAMEAYFEEGKSGEQEPKLRAALALGLSIQGRFDDAFKLLPPDDPRSAPIWKRLAFHGTDGTLIKIAIAATDEGATLLDNSVDQKIAERLIGLGFGKESAFWVLPGRRSSGLISSEDQLLAAKSQLLIRDARSALRTIADLESPESQKVRADALSQLGDPTASDAYEKAGDLSAVARSARQQNNWQVISALPENDPWGEAARLLDPLSKPLDALNAQVGSLAQGRIAVTESVAARETLRALLETVRAPNLTN